MKLSSTRSLESLKVVLKNPNSTGPDPTYWVFSDISVEPENSWANITIITPGNYSGEYPKTFGHYHPNGAPNETYHLIEGKGILQLQKKHFENGVLNPEKVDEVLLVRAKPGDEIIIKQEYGHCWSNIGNSALISYDDWKSGHSPSDYEPIEKLQGLAYYLVEEGGEVKAVPNPNYKDLPEPIWLTAEEFLKKQKQ